MTVTPIADMRPRMPEHGRIRMGRKSPKGAPQKLQRFRFTSQDRAAIERIAELYGGTPQPWSGSPREGEWEVIVEADAIRIVLPPDPLGGTPIYELWSGGGCQRRCNGETCEIPETEGWSQTPCICKAKARRECKMKTRLVVILRDVPFGGGWRLESSGENAGYELPGMVAAIQSLQARGITKGLLRLRSVKEVKRGRTREYVVPALALEDDVEALAAGAASLGALAPGRGLAAVAALPAASDTAAEGPPALDAEDAWPEDVPRGPTEAPQDDDGIEDADVVEDDAPHAVDLGPAGVPAGGAHDAAGTPAPIAEGAGHSVSEGRAEAERPEGTALSGASDARGSSPSPAGSTAARGAPGAPSAPTVTPARSFYGTINSVAQANDNDADTLRHGLVRLVTHDRTGSSRAMTADELRHAEEILDDLAGDVRRIIGYTESGMLRVSKKRGT